MVSVFERARCKSCIIKNTHRCRSVYTLSNNSEQPQLSTVSYFSKVHKSSLSGVLLLKVLYRSFQQPIALPHLLSPPIKLAILAQAKSFSSKSASNRFFEKNEHKKHRKYTAWFHEYILCLHKLVEWPKSKATPLYFICLNRFLLHQFILSFSDPI